MSGDEGYFLKMKKDHFWDYFPPKNPVNSTIVFLCWGLGAKNVSRFQPTFITGPSPSLVVKVPPNLLATLGTFYWTFRENGTKKRLNITGIIMPRAGFFSNFIHCTPKRSRLPLQREITSLATLDAPIPIMGSRTGPSERPFLPTRQECISDLGAFGWSWSGTASVVCKSMLVIWKTCFHALSGTQIFVF